MPGAYATHLLATRILGQGALAWRCFDLGLLLCGGLCMQVMARRGERLAALSAACLFAVAHGGDGIAQIGQRDLVISVLLLAGIACLGIALESRSIGHWAFGFGFLHGLAASIKPTSALITVLCLAYTVCALRLHPGRRLFLGIYSTLGFSIPLFCFALYLWREHALGAFWFVFHILLPYHAAISRHHMGYLLLHSCSPFLAIILFWVICLALDTSRGSLDPRRTLLATATVGGLSMYVAQGKGFPYHRYSFLIFLLPLIWFDFNNWIRTSKRLWLPAVAGLVTGACVVAPLSVMRTWRYQPADPFGRALEHDLSQFHRPELDGRVQCLDSVQGCNATLSRMRLREATSLFYDEFIFGEKPGKAVEDSRSQFIQEIRVRPPVLFVIVDGYFLSSDDQYAKVERWPGFAEFLRAHYHLYADRSSPGVIRWWGRPNASPGYRLYALNGTREPASRWRP